MVTADMKLRHLHLGRKAMTNLDSILKSRDITLLTKAHIVKAMFFPVVILLGRKAVTNLDSILKSRDISLPTIVRLGFPVVMHGG